jgi:hypothetical protein
MTEDECIAAHELKEKIVMAIGMMVDLALINQTAEADDLIRTQLLEQVRYWK